MKFHKSQVFFYLSASFLLGIFIASFFTVGQTVIYGGFIMAIGLIAVFGYKKSFNVRFLLVGFMGIAFLFGAVRFNSADFKRDALDFFIGLEAGGEGIEVAVIGYVEDIVDDKGKAEVVLLAKELILGERMVNVNDKVLITTEGFNEFEYGDVVQVEGALRKPENFSDDFDYITYLKTKGIRTTMFYPEIKNYDGLRLGAIERLKVAVYGKIFAVKNKFQDSVNKTISEPGASYISAIMLGNRQNIPDEIRENFNKTSASHILAISGMHISIIATSLLAFLVSFFVRRKAFWISAGIIIMFAVLTGASSSVVRASIMGLLVLFAYGYGRLYNPGNSIIFAGSLMVFFNPFLLRFNVGFQLSFLAVMGLIYFAPVLKTKLKKVPEFWGIKEIAIMTASAQLFVLPMLLNQFNIFSAVSLPVNILVLPFVPFAMLFGFLSGAGGLLFIPLGQVFGYFAWAITYFQFSIIEFFASLSFSSYNVSIHWLTMTVVYLILFFWTAKLRKKQKNNA